MLYALIGHVKTTRFTGGYYLRSQKKSSYEVLAYVTNYHKLQQLSSNSLFPLDILFNITIYIIS